MRRQGRKGITGHMQLLVTAVALAVSAASCSSGPSTPAARSAGSPSSEDAGAPSPHANGEAGTGSQEAPEDSAVDAGQSPPPGFPGSEAEPPDPGKKRRGPPPFDFPYETPVPVRAALEPECIERGDVVTLDVTTEPEAAVVYHALYSDGYGGSGPPYGKGYGGNDKGYSDKSGDYESIYVVAANAPAGGGRMDVIVGFEGEWGYAKVRFAIADSSGDCPKKWLRGNEGGK